MQKTILKCLALAICILFAKNSLGDTEKCSPKGEQTISSASQKCNQAARLAFVNGDIKSVERECALAIREEEQLRHQDERLVYPLLQLAYSYYMSEDHQKESLKTLEKAVAIRHDLYSSDNPCLDELRGMIERLRSTISEGKPAQKEPNNALQRTPKGAAELNR